MPRAGDIIMALLGAAAGAANPRLGRGVAMLGNAFSGMEEQRAKERALQQKAAQEAAIGQSVLSSLAGSEDPRAAIIRAIAANRGSASTGPALSLLGEAARLKAEKEKAAGQLGNADELAAFLTGTAPRIREGLTPGEHINYKVAPGMSYGFTQPQDFTNLGEAAVTGLEGVEGPRADMIRSTAPNDPRRSYAAALGLLADQERVARQDTRTARTEQRQDEREIRSEQRQEARQQHQQLQKDIAAAEKAYKAAGKEADSLYGKIFPLSGPPNEFQIVKLEKWKQAKALQRDAYARWKELNQQLRGGNQEPKQESGTGPKEQTKKITWGPNGELVWAQ